MKKPTGLQTVIYNGTKKYCKHCNTDLTDINNSTYLKERWGSPKFWDELCKCDNCQNKYLLRHELFDTKGHVHLFVFTEDINNPEYSWIDNLNNKQKIAVGNHINQCDECQAKITRQLCSDAELKNTFKKIRGKR